MKLSFSLISFFFISYFSVSSHAQAIIMSGNLSPSQRITAEKVTSRIIGKGQLVHWEENNLKCRKKAGHLLQICWKGLNLKIVYQKKAMLKNTVGRLIEMNQTQKAFIKKASL